MAAENADELLEEALKEFADKVDNFIAHPDGALPYQLHVDFWEVCQWVKIEWKSEAVD